MISKSSLAAVATLACFALSAMAAEDEVIPRRQTKPPGPALSPAEAIAKMQAPPGFTVERVVSEPELVNPVAMTFDERGRVWITESLEYPRRQPGPGRDRVKVFEDTDGDGAVDKSTVFATGLNIPSGIAVGHGGVWVANAPDILFMQDTDGDGVADKQEVVVTGFGRTDTHELPNSLTWGPDGWLYGINGVFNHSHVKYRGKEYVFTCAIFRIHPRTREFELFCEGTSNPWGIAWDREGSLFVSACVIDHLWHLVETGYYHRQGGPYPAFTWKIESIVKHRHQLAAYCGLHWFDSDAYPAEFREKLYMGNIHGGCVNVDQLRRDGATYFGTTQPDFLTANDVWFMPIVQKTGPDGCLYVLDWYDRYHCYQDANRDPEGVDRLKGRLYRIRYQDTPRRVNFDLAKSTDAELVKLLASGNGYDREIAQRLLQERNSDVAKPLLEAIVLDASAPQRTRLHALWSLVGAAPLSPEFHERLFAQTDATLRAWAVRAAGNMKEVTPQIRNLVIAGAGDASPDVRLQTAIASTKIPGVDTVKVLIEVVSNTADDVLIPRIVWQNLHPRLDGDAAKFVAEVEARDLSKAKLLAELMPRAIERMLAAKPLDPPSLARLFDILAKPGGDAAAAQQCLALLAGKVQTRELAGKDLAAVQQAFAAQITKVLAGQPTGPMYLEAAFLATSWKDPQGIAAVRSLLASEKTPEQRRLQALDALIAANDAEWSGPVQAILSAPQKSSAEFRGNVIAALGRLSDAKVADCTLDCYAVQEPELQPRIIELLTQRGDWAKRLLAAIGENKLPPSALNVNQIRKLLESKDAELVAEVRRRWGTIRTDRNPEREQVIAEIRRFVRKNPGNALAGEAIFTRVCAQCHQMHGKGQQVGPDITSNGRASFEQLLSNIFDPSLVIGVAYQARTVATVDGRVLTGLLVEESDQRIVLKVQGGKLETIPRADVDDYTTSKLSLMPEGLEKQLQPEELANLIAYLVLDKPPTDPSARPIPGVRELTARATTRPEEFADLLADFAPAFSTQKVGDGGLAIVAEHHGRQGVLRTHPVSESEPCKLSAKIDVPANKKTRLVLAVSHDRQGDWQLVVRGNQEVLLDKYIGAKTTKEGWTEISVDLSKFAGKQITLELANKANNWAWEFGYWGRIEVISE